jgi:hypothetical protein
MVEAGLLVVVDGVAVYRRVFGAGLCAVQQTPRTVEPILRLNQAKEGSFKLSPVREINSKPCWGDGVIQ